MIYLFQVILLVFVLASGMLIGVFWSSSNLSGRISLSNSAYKYMAAASGFLVYAFVDYSMLDYLMLIPGANYVIA